MFRDILTQEQTKLIELLDKFGSEFYLAGGTAIALQLGHRRSLDFDLFTFGESVKHTAIQNKINTTKYTIQKILFKSEEQIHFIVNGIKISFLAFPFQIERKVSVTERLTMPDLNDLAAMKAYALGGRGKWKDYIDLYFLFKDQYSLGQIEKRAEEIFGSNFSSKLFREQLTYFDDIDYTEQLEYTGNKINDDEVRNYLTELATGKI